MEQLNSRCHENLRLQKEFQEEITFKRRMESWIQEIHEWSKSEKWYYEIRINPLREENKKLRS